MSDAKKREAGYETDCEIHARVFGRRLFTHEEMLSEAQKTWMQQRQCSAFLMGFIWWSGGQDAPTFRQSMPRYSADLNEAFRVADKMREKGWPTISIDLNQKGSWDVVIERDEREIHGTASDFSAAIAICRASLRALDSLEDASTDATTRDSAPS